GPRLLEGPLPRLLSLVRDPSGPATRLGSDRLSVARDLVLELAVEVTVEASALAGVRIAGERAGEIGDVRSRDVDQPLADAHGASVSRGLEQSNPRLDVARSR